MSESAKACEGVGFVSGIKAFKAVATKTQGVIRRIGFPVFEVTVLSELGGEFRFLCGREALPNLGEKIKCTISFERVGDDDDADAA